MIIYLCKKIDERMSRLSYERREMLGNLTDIFIRIVLDLMALAVIGAFIYVICFK